MATYFRVDQYHFIREQARKILQTFQTTADPDVKQAVKQITWEQIHENIPSVTDEQKQLLLDLFHLHEKEAIDLQLAELKKMVIPFPEINEQRLKRLFPKAKNLKMPELSSTNLQEIVYMRWVDKGTQKTFMVVPHQDKFLGIHGALETSSHKGICAICHELEEVSLFTTETKGRVRGTYSKKGNYICKDPEVCNFNITDLSKLDQFVLHLRND